MTSKEREVVLNILELYQDMPYLWQKSHKDYLNKDIRNEGLQVLLQVYKHVDDKANISTLKKKLLNMRSNYNKELSKVIASKTTGAGAEEVYVPKLWYFEALSFLGSTNEPCRDTSDTLTCSLESETPKLGLSSDEENDPQREQTASTYRYQPKKRRETLLTKQEKLLESAKNLFSNKENEWEVFGKSVGLQMKDLNKKQLTIAQKIISDVIFLAKLDRLSEDSYVVTKYSYQSPHHSSLSPHNNSLPPHYNRPSSGSEHFRTLSAQNKTSSYGSQFHRYQAPLVHNLNAPNDNVEPQYQPCISHIRSTYVHAQAPQHSIKTPQLAIPVHSAPQHAIQSPQNTIKLQPKATQSRHHSMQSAHHSIQSPQQSPYQSIQSPQNIIQSPRHSIHLPQHLIQSPQNTSQSQPIAIQSRHHSMQSAHHSIQSPQQSPYQSIQSPQNIIQSPRHSIHLPQHLIQSPQNTSQSQPITIQSRHHSMQSAHHSIQSPQQSPYQSIQSPQNIIQSPRHSIHLPQHLIQSPQNTSQSQPITIQSRHHSMQSAHHSIQSPQQSPYRSIQSPQNTIQSPHHSIQSPDQSIQSPQNTIQSPHHSIQSPYQSIQSPQNTIQSPHHSIQSPQDLIQSQQVTSPSHSFTSSSQTITVYQAEDYLKYIDTDLGPAEILSPTITEGPANADVWKEFFITKSKNNKPKKK